MLTGGRYVRLVPEDSTDQHLRFELEFNHPPEVVADPDNVTGEGPSRARRAVERPVPPAKTKKTVPPGARITVYGTVLKTLGKDLGIRVRNEAELREFWRANEVDTDLDWFGTRPPFVRLVAWRTSRSAGSVMRPASLSRSSTGWEASGGLEQ